MPERTREELLEYLKTCSPRARNTFIQIIEGKVSENDATALIREKVSFMEPDLTPRELTLMSSRLCDCGKLISQQNALQGRCEHPGCDKFVCAGCARVCAHCCKIFGPEHATVYGDGEIYCSKCRRIKWGKILLSIGKRIVK